MLEPVRPIHIDARRIVLAALGLWAPVLVLLLGFLWVTP